MTGKGEDDVTVQAVADRAGVGIGSLYDYFRDRRSLLAAFAAKVTEDNRLAFEALLEITDGHSIEEGVTQVVDLCLTRFTSKKYGLRAVMRIAHAVGYVPTIAQSTDVAAMSLSRALRRRTDIRVPDVDLAAWLMTHTMMGVAHTLVWQDTPRFSNDALRAELITLFSDYLGRDRAATAPAPP